MIDNELSRDLFLATLTDFHRMMGDKTFWNNPEAQVTAIKALGQDYIRVDHEDKLDKDATSLEAVFSEYNRRKAYMGNTILNELEVINGKE